MYDTLIKNAFVLDGTGRAGFAADVAIKDGKISRIGSELSGAARVIDAKGLTLTPGFIDSHSHSDLSILTDRDQPAAPEQGITFSIAGQCGSSFAPGKRTGTYMSMPEFLDRVCTEPIGSGLALLTGHGSIRSSVMGTVNRAPTAQELAQMEQLLVQSLEAGSIGLSFGLTYVPGSYAQLPEMITLAKVVKRYEGVITAHIRNEGDTLLESVEEFIAVIKASGCRGIISHHKAADRANWGKVKDTIAMIDKANAEGADIYMDVYPYCASSTSLLARFMPKQFHPKGATSVLALLDDPGICRRAKQWALDKWGDDLSWVLVYACSQHPEYEGMNMNQVAEKMGITDRYKAVYQLIRMCKGKAQACFTMMCEEDVKRIMAHPRAMIGADSNMSHSHEKCHPRLRATFPRTLAKYVREEKVTTLPEMIRKMTGLPATVYGLHTKGMIDEGYDADICIFDPDRIQDMADYVNCHAPNEGLHYVLIGGKIVVENNSYTGIRAAQCYRKR